MTETFPVSGNIEPASFPHLLVDLHRHGATGSLKVNGPVFPKALYFRGGRVLFGSSNDPRDQLGEILIESGKITREQLDDVNAKVGPGNPLAKVLAESGFVNQRELGDAARVKVERILSDVLSWESGSFEFEDGVLPKGAVDLKLSTERLLLAAVQRIGDRAFALRHLGGDMSVVLEPDPEGETALSEVRAEVWPLLERLDGERSLLDAVALTRLDEFAAAKMACAMRFLGIVRRKATRGEDELDLAQEARSGFGGDEAMRGAEAPLFEAESAPGSFLAGEDAPRGFEMREPSAEPVGVPDEPVGIQDEPIGVRDEPAPVASAQAETTALAFPEPEPTPLVPEGGVAFALPFPEPEADGPPPLAEPEPSVPSLRRGEATGFAFVDASEASPVPDTAPPPKPVGERLSSPPPEAPLPAPLDFAAPAPRRPVTDTVPGDRPLYVPPPSPPSPVPDEAPAPPEPPATPGKAEGGARPTQEDLAALDALLNPSRSQRLERLVDRPRTERYAPQFRPPTGGSRPRTGAGRPAGGSRAPLVAGVAGLLLAVVAGGYLLLRQPSPSADGTPPAPTPRATATPALSAPVTIAAVPSVAPSPTPEPTDDATPPVAALPSPALQASPTPPPSPAATPVSPTPAAATTAASPATGSAAEARALLRQGALSESARGFAASLVTGAGGRYSVQTLVACAPETVQKAATNVTGDELFILPVELNGRSCYRVCWGVYESREGAEEAARVLPAYFRQGGISPRVQPLVELLP